MVFFHIFCCIYYFYLQSYSKNFNMDCRQTGREKLVKCVSLLWHNAWYLLSPFLQSITLQVVLGEELKEFCYMFRKALKFIAYDPLFPLVLPHPLLKHCFNSQEEKEEYLFSIQKVYVLWVRWLTGDLSLVFFITKMMWRIWECREHKHSLYILVLSSTCLCFN